MQLKRLILYGRNDETRCVEFRQGELNIFTGDSKTGKTAVIDIVDYCLGSKLCNVAEGVIRDKVRYYALVVANGDEEIFICRPDPPTPQQTSHEIMVIVGSDLGIPKLTEFKPNFNLDSLKDFLSESLGIRENLSEPGVTRRALTANFRHALGFCFQEQGEIAQRGFLFHGSSDNFVALAIRDTLSYFLGAVEDERPALRAELRDATRTLTLAERRLDEAVTIGGQGFTKGITLLTEARQLGLDPFTTDASERSELEARLLAAVALAESPGDLPEIPGEVREQVNNERAMLMERIGTVSTQIEAYNNIGREESGYKSALSEQRQRLESIGLFSAPEPELHSCPVCGSLVDLPTNTDFESALSILSEELQGVEVTKPRLENVIRNLENERSVLSKQLASNRLKAEALAAQDEELRRSRDLSTSRARLAGRISFYLESGALSAKDENEALKSAVQRAN